MNKYQSDFLERRRKRQAREIHAGIQPFKLVKYFSYTSLVVILVASFFLSLIISNNAKRVLLDRSESYSELFAENLSRQVFLRFVLPTAIQYGAIALSNETQFERLDLVVRNVTRGMGIDSVTIFDSNENIISYSTIPELVGKEDKGGIEYRKALLGESNSVLISSASLINLLPGARPVYCKLKTYIPFRSEEKLGERQGNIMGVIEVVNDLSDDMEAIIKLQGRIILLSLVIMGVLFGALSYIVFRADRIIEARADERRQLEVKLHETERLATLGKMVAAVSHEIKNPLGIVRSTAEILGKRISKVAPGNEHLANIIVDETSRLDNIVREFLDFARPKELQPEMVSLNTLVERAASFMQPEFENKSVEPVLDLDPQLPRIPLDPEQIYQVLLNVMINGVQAMPDGGTISLRSRVTLRGDVELDIGDTGTGMPPEKAEQIFTPFFTDKNRGSGLGLAIAKNIIDKHNGRITVVSNEGQGSTFTLTFSRSLG
ncbi:MAG: ATP-binding protein [Desulfobulbaceae bacterium]|nr:ATP-binding protein [Desulfobulbaceae bacterium]